MKKILILVLFVVFSFCGTKVAKAATISNSGLLINDNTKSSIISIYENSIYSNYILSSYRNDTGYNTYTYYYLCLTNDFLDPIDSVNIKSDCNELYTIYNNTISKEVDSSLSITDSVYYTNNYENVLIYKFIFILLSSMLILYCLLRISGVLDVWFSHRGGGLKYDDI